MTYACSHVTWQERVTAAQRDLAVARDEIEGLRRDVRTTRAAELRLVDEKAQLLTELNELRYADVEMTAHSATVDSDLERANQTITHLEYALESLHQELEQVRREVSIWKMRVQVLHTRLTRVTQTHTSNEALRQQNVVEHPPGLRVRKKL